MLAIPSPVSVVSETASMIAEAASMAVRIRRAIRGGTKEFRSASSVAVANRMTISASIHRPAANADSR
jgi:hypothetical protein